MRKRTIAVIGVLVLAMLGLAGVSSQAVAKADKPTVVLVHGAFAESASWDGVIKRLDKAGYPVVAVANPLRSVSGDATYLRSVLAGIKGPIVLVGHSYGGQVMTPAATGNQNVKALVYIAAFAPAKSESALDLTNKFPGSTLGAAIQSIPLGDGSNDVTIQPAKFREQFMADVSRKEAALAAVTQRPIRDVALSEGAGDPAWTSIPSWFLIPTGDKNIPPAVQHFMADRAHAKAVVEVKGASHAVAVSEPGKVADLIKQAATATR
ncbi:alpha/beta hydrolase [Kribbella lupini]|uniref:Alpha/beta hydrolase n=1 Tax=Kribbella lupini TaxID=291602 RepID=A0ABN2B0Y2_9ACTN